MRILCWYRELDEKNALTLVRFAPHTEFVQSGSPHLSPVLHAIVGMPGRKFPEPILGGLKQDLPGLGYWNAIVDRWATDDLMIVEPDIEITAEVVPSFQACPESWCVYTYDRFDGLLWEKSLGCVRFRKELQQRESFKVKLMAKYHPEMPERGYFRAYGPLIGPMRDPRHFTRIGSSINNSLREYGYMPHEHGKLDCLDGVK